MRIVDHGKWEIYEPERPPPELLGQRVMFCRRISDGKDWYQFQRELLNDNIKITVDSGNTVQATHRDVSMMFPAGMRLLEVESDVRHESLRQHIYDGNTFLPPRLRDTDKVSFLIALHHAGLLQRWEDYVANLSDVPARIELQHSHLLLFDSAPMKAALRELGLDDARLTQMLGRREF